MLYLNIRHTLPRIGIDMHISTLSSRIKKPQPQGDYEAPQSKLGYSQPSMEVDSYPSRHSYGHSTMKDFTKQCGDQGKSDVRQSTSKHAQDTWSIIDNAARKGRDIFDEQADGRLSAEVSKQRHIEAKAIPDPIVTMHPSELHGTTEPGHHSVKIETSSTADVKYNPGKFEVYLQDRGSIRMWTTEGHYDIYA